MANIRLHACLAISLAAFLSACNKDKPAPAVVEETPMEAAPTNTDTSAVMQEEPALSQVGGGKVKNSHQTAPAGIVQDGRYVVQVSVFKSARKAGALVEKLAASGYPAYVAEVQDPTPELSGAYHRVRVGTFRTLQDARQFGDNTVKPLGYDFWVDKKSMDNVGVRDGGSGSYSAPAPAAESNSSISEPTEPSGSSYTPAPSLPEPPAPSQPSAPAVETWESTPSPAPVEPVAPATPAPSAPEPPAPASTSGWGNPSDSAASSAPADTGAPKLDDW